MQVHISLDCCSASGCPIACKNKEKYLSHATSGISYAEKFGGSSSYNSGTGAEGSSESDPLKEKVDEPMDTSEGGHLDTERDNCDSKSRFAH